MRRRFVTLDVFTDKRFAGNPLAVVLEPDGLDTPAMQTIAREFNLSETVFVFPPADKAQPRQAAHLHAGARACRSPAIRRSGPRCCSAASTADAGARLRAGGEHRPGAVPRDSLRRRTAGARRSTFRACPRRSRRAGDDATIAAALGLAAGDIGFDGLAAARWSAGNPFTIVPVRGLDAIGRCRVDLARFERPSAAAPRGGLHRSAARPPRPATRFHARMFAPRHGRARGSGDRLGGRGLRGLSGGARRLPGRRAPRARSSRATRWAARA